MRTPAEINEPAKLYLQIYISGLVALTVYNMGTAILNAMGDSKSSLIFLALSAAINVVPDLVFVTQLHMGVAGVAWATVIAEAVSAVAVTLKLRSPGVPCRFSLRGLKLDFPMLKNVVAIGVPVGFQQVVVGISNILLQIYINRLGSVYVAAWGIAAKLDAFIFTLPQAISMAAATFVGQNLGARRIERAKQGVRISLLLGFSTTIVMSAILLLLNVRILRIFTPDSQLISAAFEFMRVLTSTYFNFTLNQIIPAALAGLGLVRVPMIISISTQVVLRQIYLAAVAAVNYTPTTVAISYPFSWALAGIALVIYYRKCDWYALQK
jgi:putative MATE family efflux protein